MTLLINQLINYAHMKLGFCVIAMGKQIFLVRSALLRNAAP